MTELSDEQKTFLGSLYFDISKPGAYGGLNNFYKQVIKAGRGDLSSSQVTKWLQGQEAYSLHKPVKKRFQHRRVLVESIDEQWDSDLISLITFAQYNEGFKYILLCVDTLSKYIWLEPIKSKTAPEMKKAFNKIFELGRKCLRLRSDKGGEYTSAIINSYFKDENIIHFVTYNSVKANFSERVIRTIKKPTFQVFSPQTNISLYRYSSRSCQQL
jgi:hypothetical protein